MKTKIIFLIVFLFLLTTISFSQTSIKSVKIGNQVWMTENLNADRFRNGDLIPEAKTKEEWTKANRESKPAWCYYENNPENGKKCGKLYNWYAVNDKRGLAPEGWHISTKAEFEALESAVNKNSNLLKAAGQGERDGVGTNTSGFSALLAGCRKFDGEFLNIGRLASFWSSTQYNGLGAECQELMADENSIWFNAADKGYGNSVRCVKD